MAEEGSYSRLESQEEGAVSRPSVSERHWLRRLGFVFVSFALVLSLLVLVSTSSSSEDSSLLKQEFWTIPRAYKVHVTLTLPYSGLVEDALVYVDQNKGAQRVSYYGGRNVFIFNSSGPSYSIVPAGDKKVCLYDLGETPAQVGTPLQDVFPKDLAKLFSIALDPSGKEREVEVIRGVECNVYRYSYSGSLGDSDGYFGNYTFYVSADGNLPVQMRFVGHNIFLGGSHVDEYIIDYDDFEDLSESGGVPDKVFQIEEDAEEDAVASWCRNKRDQTDEEKRSEEEQNERRIAMLHEYDQHLLFPGEARDSEMEALFNKHGEDNFENGWQDLGIDSEAEKRFRHDVFHANRRHIMATNRMGKGYFLKANRFAHLTEKELQKMNGQRQARETLCNIDSVEKVAKQKAEHGVIPRKVDYVNEQKLSLPPGDQGTCGSCWTFGATGAVEAAFAKVTGQLQAVSKQNLLDCSWGVPYSNHGCNGGTDFKGYEWILNNAQGRIASDASYPYSNQEGFCRFDSSKNVQEDSVQVLPAKVTECFVVTERFLNNSWVSDQQSVDAFVYKLATEGPLAISINASPKDFYFYTAGVFSSSECKGDVVSLDHSVLAVGYDLDGDYMVMRNSWSTHWGEGGYARLKLSSNTCGFATTPTYVHAVADQL